MWLLGAALRRQECNEEAKQILKPLTAAQPQIKAAWFELGLAYADLKERDLAEGALTRAVDLNWLDEESWYALGDVLLFPDEWRNVGPGTDVFLGEAETELRNNHPQAAERILRDMLVAYPADAGALKLLADALIRLDRWPEAEPLLERALEIAPNFIAGHSVTSPCAA